MPYVLGLIALFTLLPQSGRRTNKEVKVPPPVVEEPKESPEKPTGQDQTPVVTAERNQEYVCTDDGSLLRIVDPVDETETVFSSKQVDTRVVIKAQPRPSYTREARRNSVEGNVILKLVLSGTGKVGRIRVVRGLPFGLTENAIKVACKLEFKPAVKDGKPVSQWLQVEYAFRLAESSIFGP
jgi:TonB family protein